MSCSNSAHVRDVKTNHSQQFCKKIFLSNFVNRRSYLSLLAAQFCIKIRKKSQKHGITSYSYISQTRRSPGFARHLLTSTGIRKRGALLVNLYRLKLHSNNLKCVWTNKQTDKQMERCLEKQMDIPTNKHMFGQTNRRREGVLHFYIDGLISFKMG